MVLVAAGGILLRPCPFKPVQPIGDVAAARAFAAKARTESNVID